MTKQLPQVLIVGGVSKSFEGAYQQLLKLQELGQVEIIHREIGDDLTEENDAEYTLSDKGLLDGSIIIDELSNFNEEIIAHLKKIKYDKTWLLDRKHSKPWYLKGRW
ncbi:hypothetical protein VP14_233 [Vibrio phage VPMCC14]|nr:hypothetical protein VP14_233 [Vibrio phage VPMCC14]